MGDCPVVMLMPVKNNIVITDILIREINLILICFIFMEQLYCTNVQPIPGKLEFKIMFRFINRL